MILNVNQKGRTYNLKVRLKIKGSPFIGTLTLKLYEWGLNRFEFE